MLKNTFLHLPDEAIDILPLNLQLVSRAEQNEETLALTLALRMNPSSFRRVAALEMFYLVAAHFSIHQGTKLPSSLPWQC